jgi:hypothetical protein
MRSQVFGMAVAAALLLPATGHAQVYMVQTGPPAVTAARSPWLRTGAPVFYKGAFYYPSGPTEFFDGRIMTRTGTYDGVPLYENPTLEPYSIVFVPVGSSLVRPYERRREGRLAGSVGSRTPSFPVQRDFESRWFRDDDDWTSDEVDRPWLGGAEVTGRHGVGRAQWDWPQTAIAPEGPALVPMAPRQPDASAASNVIRSVPVRETTNAGAFVQFEDVRYYSSGRAVVNDAAQFSRAGEVKGAAVYRQVNGDPRTIFVEAVPGGGLAPYTRR